MSINKTHLLRFLSQACQAQIIEDLGGRTAQLELGHFFLKHRNMI